ncbi:site-specific integrase [Proteus mirabilis]|nr:site-specific integrase [Proteus mirabilis]
MFSLIQPNKHLRERLWVLMDSETNLPLFYPLQYLTDHLSHRSPSTQLASLQALKLFYEFWYQKYNVTFCFSFYSSSHNPLIIIDELRAFSHYLENPNSSLISFPFASYPSKKNKNIKLHTIIRFTNYLIQTYVSTRYMDSSPIELSKLANQLSKKLLIYRDEFKQSKRPVDIHFKKFKSMTLDMVKKFYTIITPSSSSKMNILNPFPIRQIQLRNFLICRLLINYGLRVGELLLLECNSIKPNLRGDKFSLIITSLDNETEDNRKRLPSLKNIYSHRVIEIDKFDYHLLTIYIKKIRPLTKHNFLFCSTKKDNSPLSYYSIYSIFEKINDVFIKSHPEYYSKECYDSIEKITPHIARHTWAYLTLQRIYNDKINMDKKIKNRINFSTSELMNDALNELRILGGWSQSSNMPILYAKRFLSENANKANLRRISIDYKNINHDADFSYDDWRDND